MRATESKSSICQALVYWKTTIIFSSPVSTHTHFFHFLTGHKWPTPPIIQQTLALKYMLFIVSVHSPTAEIDHVSWSGGEIPKDKPLCGFHSEHCRTPVTSEYGTINNTCTWNATLKKQFVSITCYSAFRNKLFIFILMFKM